MRDNQDEERWMKLCQQASTEKDPEKLLKLVKEINGLLESKEKRRAEALTTTPKDGNPGTDSH